MDQQKLPWDVFLPITFPNFDNNNYWISNTGMIYDAKSNRIKKQHIDHAGYKRTALKMRDGKWLNTTIHRLVAWEFCPGRDIQLVVNHKDGNKTNNYYQNLEWCTSQENIYHAYRTGLMDNRFVNGHNGWKTGDTAGIKNPRHKLTEDDIDFVWKQRQKGLSADQIAFLLDDKVCKSTIKAILSGKSWKHLSNK